ncbi:hypothetical protein Mapa_017392 [Marchantia paleacea]|nr:hypothetical protein Mapa_017392 [Marchantia paleacea]
MRRPNAGGQRSQRIRVLETFSIDIGSINLWEQERGSRVTGNGCEFRIVVSSGVDGSVVILVTVVVVEEEKWCEA